LYQQTKSLLTEENLTKFVKEKINDLGTSACPPYHLALVIGGTSAEATLAAVKKASAGYYDNLPTEGNEGGQAFRDLEWEEKVTQICRESGIGAQFGGKYFVHDVRVIRLPRHAASCPVGLGVVAVPTATSKQKLLPMEFSWKNWRKTRRGFCPKKRRICSQLLTLISTSPWKIF
jgi:fumarate hydratase, class I